MEIAGFQRDISNMMMSLEVGALSSDDLDALKTAEGKRGTYTIKLIEMIAMETEKIHTLYEKMADCILKKVQYCKCLADETLLI